MAVVVGTFIFTLKGGRPHTVTVHTDVVPHNVSYT